MDNRAIGVMIQYFKKESYVAHSLKVLGYAQGIAAGENLAGEELAALELAALFHDVSIPAGLTETGKADGPIQERLGAPIAMDLCKNFSKGPVVGRVGFLVGNHHSFDVEGGLALQILFEADWLVNLAESPGKHDPAQVCKDYFQTETGKAYFHALFH